jgi:hypothetical protein
VIAEYRGNKVAIFDTETEKFTAFWTGSNHGAALVKLEPLD